LGDPLYPRKLNALYHEFVETGVHEKLGYTSPADLVEHYPQFYWSKIERFLGHALRYLEMTMEGKQWIATLYCHIFAIEHDRRRMGPQSGPPQHPRWARSRGRSRNWPLHQHLKKLGTFPASDIAPTRVQQSPAESSFRCNAIGVSDGAPPIAAECANVDERGG
jgi:hypothetical protein